MNKNILVTGGSGFIGFNFIQYLVNLKIKDLNIINVDKITYASLPYYGDKVRYFNEHNIHNYKYDICNYDDIKFVIDYHKINGIINFAAETHVDNSIKNPDVFIKSNIDGVLNLLKLSNEFNLRFHQISTDEVYGSVDPINDIVDEKFKYNTASPYSASKASADLLTLAFYKTYGTKVTISRCTNNYGRYQHAEKLIPKVIHNIKNNIKIPVYGDGKQMRNWIHVLDHCDAIWKIFNNGRIGEIYNVGSDTLITNIDLIHTIIQQLNSSVELIEHVTDRPGHDLCYHLCSNKIQNELNWKQNITFENGITDLLNFEVKNDFIR
jgi:dTDP-glucose 4,6-dehydratase